MDRIYGKLTVFFDQPFWVGVYERTEKGETRVCRVVFGAEPKDHEVYEYFLRAFSSLRFSPAVEGLKLVQSRPNPKRMQRLTHKVLTQSGVGTKAQQALKLQQEQLKSARRTRRKERDDAAQARKFALRQQKKQEKHKGH